ncbi:Uncharacterized protein HZ326_14750 [Fusarium oxysporum f. sp. albedinis]|nr:Uncharacterized protein HZ326_14750 [Fusarium oxysporum f. sp. albedinis]
MSIEIFPITSFSDGCALVQKRLASHFLPPFRTSLHVSLWNKLPFNNLISPCLIHQVTSPLGSKSKSRTSPGQDQQRKGNTPPRNNRPRSSDPHSFDHPTGATAACLVPELNYELRKLRYATVLRQRPVHPHPHTSHPLDGNQSSSHPKKKKRFPLIGSCYLFGLLRKKHNFLSHPPVTSPLSLTHSSRDSPVRLSFICNTIPIRLRHHLSLVLPIPTFRCRRLSPNSTTTYHHSFTCPKHAPIILVTLAS